ncbi:MULTISPECIES: DUF4833 domain-containing protein [unclassified Siphonobacter]|uniref:DUF4833 domain-containing protein n=1 Tax=unclassified Siphonobacter TaxID=2635712 RepID=UPI000CAADA4C|nr:MULTISPECIES: DUF4833 domain-containing protein [unclassified Siphonobacter]MDQ1090344.1 hypothetical protein [Siphonobacter sp. SORGH_AS_1065]MDR6197954.1 hypothetical protein [Siphonobacter sp. SORGH_AS_0500]PKK37151.1 hypothetical protein BWI96_07280 [Siphonobacter sp. SORGH_AS_0500]
MVKFALIPLVLITFSLVNSFTARADGKPPLAISKQLFSLQLSRNSNTVMYDANIGANQKLNPEKPIDVYWIRHEEQGQRESLSKIQWKLAYGYTHTKTSADTYSVKINAFKDRAFRVEVNEGKAVALATIDGKKSYLQKIFVQLDPNSFLIPKVQYVELFGVEVQGNKSVYERILPK